MSKSKCRLCRRWVAVSRGRSTASWVRTGANAAEAVAAFLQGRNVRRKLDDLQDALDDQKAAADELDVLANNTKYVELIPALKKALKAERYATETSISAGGSAHGGRHPGWCRVKLSASCGMARAARRFHAVAGSREWERCSVSVQRALGLGFCSPTIATTAATVAANHRRSLTAMENSKTNAAMLGMLTAAVASWDRYDTDTQRRLRNLRDDTEDALSQIRDDLPRRAGARTAASADGRAARTRTGESNAGVAGDSADDHQACSPGLR